MEVKLQQPGRREIDLLQMVRREGIKVGIEAKDWKDAIVKTGELMVKIGVAKPEYIDAMIKTVEEMGPYIVITKHIALPHARPEEGALEPALVFVKLKKPIEFGNPDNDPVKLLIGLVATDSRSHTKALAQLAKLLMQEEFTKRLLEAESEDEIYNLILEYVKRLKEREEK
mgnify:CR=1 FL=1